MARGKTMKDAQKDSDYAIYKVLADREPVQRIQLRDLVPVDAQAVKKLID